MRFYTTTCRFVLLHAVLFAVGCADGQLAPGKTGGGGDAAEEPGGNGDGQEGLNGSGGSRASGASGTTGRGATPIDGSSPGVAGAGGSSTDDAAVGVRPGTGRGTGGSAGRGGVGGSGSGGGGRAMGGSGGAAGKPMGTGGSGGTKVGGSGGTKVPDGGTAGSAAGMGGKASDGGAGSVTVWIAGDSTVANGSTPCPSGWGAHLASYFNSKVTVTNRANGGRSVLTWLYTVTDKADSKGDCVLEKDANGNPVVSDAWQAMLKGMKAGDYLFIQFGINDGSATCPRHVSLDNFQTTFGMMAQAAKDRGANPIFVTPASAIACNGNTARATRGSFVTATQEAGAQYGAPVIDLHALTIALYNKLGFCPIPGGSDVSATTTGPVGDFFCEDHTHFDKAGAAQVAGLIAQAIRDEGLGLAAYLK